MHPITYDYTLVSLRHAVSEQGVVVRLVVCTSSQEDPTVGTLTPVFMTGDQPTAHVVLVVAPPFCFSCRKRLECSSIWLSCGLFCGALGVGLPLDSGCFSGVTDPFEFLRRLVLAIFLLVAQALLCGARLAMLMEAFSSLSQDTLHTRHLGLLLSRISI